MGRNKNQRNHFLNSCLKKRKKSGKVRPAIPENSQIHTILFLFFTTKAYVSASQISSLPFEVFEIVIIRDCYSTLEEAVPPPHSNLGFRFPMQQDFRKKTGKSYDHLTTNHWNSQQKSTKIVFIWKTIGVEGKWVWTKSSIDETSKQIF